MGDLDRLGSPVRRRPALLGTRRPGNAPAAAALGLFLALAGCAQPPVGPSTTTLGQASVLRSAPVESGSAARTTSTTVPGRSPAANSRAPITTPTVTSTRFAVADWPIFDTVDDLVRASTVVLVGRITGVKPSNQQPDRPGTPPNKRGNGAVDTAFSFSVEQVVARLDGPRPAGSIDVRTSNGQVDRVRHIVGGAAWYVVGQRYLVFLRLFPEDAVYADAGGVQAVYPVGADGRLALVDDPYLHSPVMDRIDGRSIEQLSAMIQAVRK